MEVDTPPPESLPSTAQRSRARKVERTKELEKRVVTLTKERDELIVKNRMMRHIMDLKASTRAGDARVTQRGPARTSRPPGPPRAARRGHRRRRTGTSATATRSSWPRCAGSRR